MTLAPLPAAVIFAHDQAALARFYAGVTGMRHAAGDARHTVLRSDGFELVLHALAGEPAPSDPAHVREDTYIKPCFVVDNLALARERAQALGGRLKPVADEWDGRGFRACDGADPEGNVFQLREPLPR